MHVRPLLQSHMQEIHVDVIGMTVIMCRPDPLQRVCTVEVAFFAQGTGRVGFIVKFCMCQSCLEPKSSIFQTYILDHELF